MNQCVDVDFSFHKNTPHSEVINPSILYDHRCEISERHSWSVAAQTPTVKASTTMASDDATPTVYLKDYAPYPYDVEHVRPSPPPVPGCVRSPWTPVSRSMGRISLALCTLGECWIEGTTQWASPRALREIWGRRVKVVSSSSPAPRTN